MLKEHISQLIHLSDKEKQAIDEFVFKLRAQYGEKLKKVILYGSKARGDFQGTSDIDLLIVLKEMGLRYDEIKRINCIASPLCLEYGVVISAFPVREEQVERLTKTGFLENVLREGIPL